MYAGLVSWDVKVCLQLMRCGEDAPTLFLVGHMCMALSHAETSLLLNLTP